MKNMRRLIENKSKGNTTQDSNIGHDHNEVIYTIANEGTPVRLLNLDNKEAMQAANLCKMEIM
jgi:hypothetical protein